MSEQREMFSRSLKSPARNRWTNSILEESIIKQIRDGLNCCRIPNLRIRERIPYCHRCKAFLGKWSESGIPDLVGWIPGKLGATLLLVEVKRPKNAVESEAQKQVIERAQKDGGIALFARSWDAVAETLRSAGVKIPEGL